MGAINSYPVFEADQVLSADHLNRLFNYLDEENRLTRTRLLGIGIACGLQSSYQVTEGTITITKGVGVSSLGYLIRFPEGTGRNLSASSVTYTHYRTYTLPEGAKVKQAMYDSWQMLELVESSEVKSGDTEIKSLNNISAYAVVLFLQFEEIDLKNCTTNDCDDKGKKAELTLKPVLVLKTDLETFSPGTLEADINLLPDLVLRRFNVPFNDLKTPTEILNAFHSIVNSQVLNKVSTAYQAAYNTFQPLLEGSDPFVNLNSTLAAGLAKVKSTNLIFTQYYYDFVNDLIKAYNELKETGHLILSECCPDENLFPFHLMLGQADSNSGETSQQYRHYFVHSPLFGSFEREIKELKQLFLRMQKMVESFKFPDASEIKRQEVKITPSKLGDMVLSERAIPYYYDQEKELYKVWSFEKTRRNRANKNLSYRSDEYNFSDDEVLNPLKYDLEPYNFFRVEGHIGKDFKEALAEILYQRDHFSLPFDVVALNARKFNADRADLNADCYFQDLESLYNVLLSELLCKVHHPICFIAKLPFRDLTGIRESTGNMFNGMAGAVPNEATAGNAGVFSEAFKTVATDFIINAGKIKEKGAFVLAVDQQKSFIDYYRNKQYQKGSFLSVFCNPASDTVGAEYLRLMKISQKNLAAPVNMTSVNNITLLIQYLYNHILYFIDTAEELIKTLVTNNLSNLDYPLFESKYELFIKESKDLGTFLVLLVSRLEEMYGTANNNSLDDTESALMSLLISEIQMLTHLCMDERIRSLLHEYEKRVTKLGLEQWFSQYSSRHPGLDHKAGVPNGGTLLLVYGQRPARGQETAFPGTRGRAAEYTASLVQEQPAYDKSFYPDNNIGAKENEKEFVDALKEYIEKEQNAWTEEQLMMVNQAMAIFSAGVSGAEIYDIQEGIVFADFYLPYLCCSDCTPLSYILQEIKPDPVKPTVTITPSEFCNDDDNNGKGYDIIASPAGGIVSGENVDAANLKFYPKGLEEGNYVIKYELNGNIATAEVKIRAPRSAEFNYQVKELPDGSFNIELAAKDETASSYEWYVDNSIAPLYFTAKAIHSVKSFEGEEYILVVELAVLSAPCSASRNKLEIHLKKSSREVTEKKAFCLSEKIVLESLEEGSKVEIYDSGGLNITENLVMLFKIEDFSSTKTFTVKYKLVDKDGNSIVKTVVVTILVPQSSFMVQFISSRTNPEGTEGKYGDLVLEVINAGTGKYSWTYSDLSTGATVKKTGAKLIIPVPFPTGQIQEVNVQLGVVESGEGADCKASNKIKLTPEEIKVLSDGKNLRIENGKISIV